MEKRYYRIWHINLVVRYVKGKYRLFLESEGSRKMNITITEKKMQVFLDNAKKNIIKS